MMSIDIIILRVSTYGDLQVLYLVINIDRLREVSGEEKRVFLS